MSTKDKKILVGAVLASVVIAVILLRAVAAWSVCGWYGYQTERETRYRAFIGCMVKVGDHWVPRNELRTEQ